MNFGQLQIETFRRVREESTNPVFFTLRDVKNALNRGLVEISDQTEWLERVQNVYILRNRPYYDLRYVLRHPCLTVGAAFNVTTNRWLIPADHQELSRGDLRWEERITEPEFLVVRSLWWLGYWPFKGSTSTIKQYYTSIPEAMCEDWESPGFPEGFHYGLVEYALHELWGHDGEVDLSWKAWKEYGAYEAGLSQWVNDRNKVPLMHRFGG